MDTLGLSHGCDATPDNGAQTRCGQTVGNGVVAFGLLWHRVQLDILRANEPSFGEPCPTCFPLPSPLQCPCCEREVTREQYDLACAELAKAARAARMAGKPS